VVHVDLALVVWFQAGAAAFLGLAFGGAMSRQAVGIAFALGGAGVAGMLAGALMPGAQPILANYVPVIDHPVFLTGLIAWFAATGVFFTAALVAPPSRALQLPEDAVVALRVAAAGNLIALVTFLVAWRTTLAGLPPLGFYELVMWGGGHVLQAANVAMMLGLWLFLLHRWSGRAVLTPTASRWLLSALVAPHAVLPFAALGGTSTQLYVDTSTQLMRWTLFPVILIVLGLSVRHIVLHRRTAIASHGNHHLAGFIGSAALIALGMILGAFIRGSNTLVPGHYHAAIGAVTLALMAAAYDFCALTSAANVVASILKRAKLQLLTFGFGQAVFAIGFGIAGVYGLGRKQYGAEQHVRTLGEYLGLGVMGLGGVLAVIGGLLFLAAMLRGAAASWRARPVPPVS
jgi:cytochrome c oxidase subunit I